MNIYPGAVWLDAGYRGLHARQPRRAVLLHTNGGSGGHLLGWWKQKASAGSSLGAHYQVLADGSSECYADPALVVYHAYSASEFAIGIETEDGGKPETPWTPKQIATIAAICVHHGVPTVMLTGTEPADGVGYHQQQAAWNVSSHNCPGSVRRAQIPDVLAAMTTSPKEEEFMSSLTDQEQRDLYERVTYVFRLLNVQPEGMTDGQVTRDTAATWSAIFELTQNMESVIEQVDAIKAQLGAA